MPKLNVSDAVLEFAVLDIYHSRNVPAGGRLQIQSLEQDWPRTGLRYSDLLDAIELLVSSNRLSLQQSELSKGRLACLILTDSGAALMTGKTAKPLQTRLHARFVLSRARKRVHDEMPVAVSAAITNRRRNDYMLGNGTLMA